MLMPVNCSKCDTPLELPQGAKSITCAVCNPATVIADPRGAPPPPQQSQPPPPPEPQPSPYDQVPPGQPHSVHGHKRALICGICYKNSKQELKGCINDANSMKHLLINRFNFPSDSVLMLTDITKIRVSNLGPTMEQSFPEDETDPHRIPIKQNIRMAMNWLVRGCQPGDSLVFHYSGHGAQKKNYNGDEIDGYDELLCPLDYRTQGLIIDDETNATLVRPLPRGAKLHATIDACHSGTVLDLPFLCRMDRNGTYTWEDHRPRSGAWKGTSGGEVISFSACDDDQNAADTDALAKVTTTGAMTYSFIQAIENGHGTTYGSILHSMRSSVTKNEDCLGCGITALLRMLLTGVPPGAMRQEPQLTANRTFDVYAKAFSL